MFSNSFGANFAHANKELKNGLVFLDEGDP